MIQLPVPRGLNLPRVAPLSGAQPYHVLVAHMRQNKREGGTSPLFMVLLYFELGCLDFFVFLCGFGEYFGVGGIVFDWIDFFFFYVG